MCVDRHRRPYRGVACEIGHEFAGEIVEAEDSALIVRGAAVFPILPCGTCEACRMEHYAQCSYYDYYGSRSDGAMAEYIAVKQENLRLMLEGVSLRGSRHVRADCGGTPCVPKERCRAGGYAPYLRYWHYWPNRCSMG